MVTQEQSKYLLNIGLGAIPGESAIGPAKGRTTCFDVQAAKTAVNWDGMLSEDPPEV